MYGLPDDFPAEVFVGTTLQEISFLEYQVRFFFGEALAITVEASFSHATDASGKGMTVHYVPVLSSGVMALTGHTVSAAVGARDGTLTLTFDNGNALAFYDSTPTYEAYSIKIGQRVIIV